MWRIFRLNQGQVVFVFVFFLTFNKGCQVSFAHSDKRLVNEKQCILFSTLLSYAHACGPPTNQDHVTSGLFTTIVDKFNLQILRIITPSKHSSGWLLYDLILKRTWWRCWKLIVSYVVEQKHKRSGQSCNTALNVEMSRTKKTSRHLTIMTSATIIYPTRQCLAHELNDVQTQLGFRAHSQDSLNLLQANITI